VEAWVPPGQGKQNDLHHLDALGVFAITKLTPRQFPHEQAGKVRYVPSGKFIPLHDYLLNHKADNFTH
jgi:hypothetical protein